MPAPLFAIGQAVVKGAKAIGKSPIFQNALAAATIAGGNAAQGRNTTLISSGATMAAPTINKISLLMRVLIVLQNCYKQDS